MTQSKFENLSAFIDGESNESSVVEQLKADKESQDKWSRYHLVRDCLREEVAPTLQFDIADNIAKALEQEPAIVAPKTQKSSIPVLGNVVPMLRQGGQFAIAASVAVAMILGYQQINQPQVDPTLNTAPTLGVGGINGGLSPVSLEQTRSLQQSDFVEQKRKINALLEDHQQQLLLKSTQAEKEVEEKEQEKQDKNK